jgi:hypothetical protein
MVCEGVELSTAVQNRLAHAADHYRYYGAIYRDQTQLRELEG